MLLRIPPEGDPGNVLAMAAAIAELFVGPMLRRLLILEAADGDSPPAGGPAANETPRPPNRK